MFEKELMICGLRKQFELLSNVIQEIERKSELVNQDFDTYKQKTRFIERNLKELRMLKRSYLAHLN